MPADRTKQDSNQASSAMLGMLPADPLDLAASALFYDKGEEYAPPDADTEAFNRFLNGNDEAFRALYDAYERQLYQIGRAHV